MVLRKLEIEDLSKSFNERKTENIVRNILQRNKTEYEKNGKYKVLIEEQKSSNPIIIKLLQNASKQGNQTGKPEFIISFPNKELLIVIECKADISKHISKDLNRFSNYAIDGVLLYSSYLSKGFDVISIGVSGENIKELRIDTWLQLKGKQARNLNITKIYSFENYFNILKKDEQKEKIEHNNLTEFSQILNNRLRDDFEFEENNRPLLVGGILLALEDDSFCSSYQKKSKPRDIANLLITTIKERLEADNLGEMKTKTMIQTYNFIKTNTNIIQDINKDGMPNNAFKNLIKDIEDNIKPFFQDYKHYDIIGEFYNEFLRYANGDGGLGIVLTPRHITDLFTELAEVNKDSVVIDNCCGTGGFLISAMKKMEDASLGDENKIEDIHKKQLIGIENNPKMFCLACSNMMLRGDGKSNISQMSCFDMNEAEIKKQKPTIGFLNPPYSKDNGHKELSFIENCLSYLEPNGICVAIVPQSCAMNTKKGNLVVKERLLKNHTLKAVMSMPDTLFLDSDKATITCIMVFEAHKPHSSTTKTWFGYWKDDGFIKIRTYGRIDYYAKYKDEIKNKWLDNYFGKKEIDGFSIFRHVDANDEWLVEPFIKTDYSRISDEDFIRTMKKYSTFLFSNKYKERVSNDCCINEKINLDMNLFNDKHISELFKVTGTKTTDIKDLGELNTSSIDERYPYVSTQSFNNGVRKFFNIFTENENVLTIDSAWCGYCAYQSFKFTASDHVEKLLPLNSDLNVYRAMFLVTLINMEQYRYSYGRKFNQKRIRETVIKLPCKGNNVDWDYIETYIKGLPYSKDILI